MVVTNRQGKYILTILVFLLVSCLSVFGGTIQWRYKIRKFVEENIVMGFSDASGNAITSYSIDLSKDLENSQVFLSVTTNKVNPYTLKVSFSAMKHSNDSTSTFLGFYKARISDLITYSVGDLDYRDVVFTSADDVVVSFSGDNSDDANNTVSFYYPISFDFSDYIEDYGAGDYVGTITVEVASE